MKDRLVPSNAEIRDVMLANGFTIKDGCDDLKPYVYQAARELLRRYGGPVSVQAQALSEVWRTNADEAFEYGRHTEAATLRECADEIEALCLQQPVSGADGVQVPYPNPDDVTPAMRAGFERLFHEANKRYHGTLKRNEHGAYADLRTAADWQFYQRAWADAISAQTQPSGNAGELPQIELPLRPAPAEQASNLGIAWHAYTGVQMLSYGRTCAEAQRQADSHALSAHGPLTNEGAHRIETLVTQMFTSGNDVPVERITINRQQYEAVLGKEQKQ